MVVDSSRPIAHVAREIGVHEITLGSWVKAYREKHAREEAQLDISERARLRELDPELRVSNLGNVQGPYRRPEDIARYEQGLRKAGLPD